MNEIWRFQGDSYMAYTENVELWQRLKGWQGAKVFARYYKGKITGRVCAMQFIFKGRLLKRMRRVLGIKQPPKSRKRVEAGRKHRDNLKNAV